MFHSFLFLIYGYEFSPCSSSPLVVAIFFPAIALPNDLSAFEHYLSTLLSADSHLQDRQI